MYFKLFSTRSVNSANVELSPTLKMITQESLDKLEETYQRKGNITLNDIAVCFESTSDKFTMNILKMLVITGRLQKIQGTTMPIRYEVIDPYASEYIDLSIGS